MRWIWFRLTAAVVALSGALAGLVVNIDRAVREGQVLGEVVAIYFSYFTVLSTLLGVAALGAAAVWSAHHPGTSREPLGIALALASATGPILLLAVVYNVLLRAAPTELALRDTVGIHLLDSYAVEVMHVALPIYVLLDLILAPRRRGLPWWSLGVLVAYPIAWIIFTMLRGEVVANPDGSTPWWYPYPFLDPHVSGGYASPLTYIGVLIAVLVAIGAAVIAVGRFRERRAERRLNAAR